MSLPPQHTGQSVQLAHLMLAKFSHTTTSTGCTAPLSWNHIIGQGDIIALFEKCQVVGPGIAQGHQKTVLKVRRYNEILEDLDLDSLAREAVAQAQSRQVGNAKPSVAVIVKSPCLAVRYPSSIGQIRRFQLKFSSDRDYYTALAILSGINCPFAESTAGSSLHTALRPSSSSSQPRPSSTSAVCAPVPVFSGTVGFAPPQNTIFNARAPQGGSSYEAQLPVPRSSISSSSSYTVCAGIDSTAGSKIGSDHEGSRRLLPLAVKSPYVGQDVSPVSGSLIGDRPSTAAVYYDAQSLNQLLPPKRELPFARPAAKKPRTSDKPSNPRRSDGVQGSRSGPSVPTITVSPDTLDANRSFTGETPLTRISAKEPERSANSDSLRPTSPTFQLDTEPPGPPRTQHESSKFSKEALQNLPLIPNPNPHAAENHSAPTPPPTAIGIITSTDLSSYLSRPAPEQSALVEAWVCQQLEDDGFLRLCQDVEGVWKRIAFGR